MLSVVVKKPHHSVPRQNSLVRCMIEHNLPRFTSHDFDKTVLIEKRGGARLGLTLSPTGVNAVVPSVVVASLAEGSPAAGKVPAGCCLSHGDTHIHLIGCAWRSNFVGQRPIAGGPSL